MSKIYDALMKLQREQTGYKKGTKPYETEPESQATEPGKEPKQKIRFLSTSPEIFPKKPRRKGLTAYERINRVSVGDFLARPDSALSEQFRKLKSAVLTHNMTKSLRSMLITSCLPEEGKTTVALNLSTTITKGMDESVILIDADLRKQNLSSLLGLQSALGLSDVLEERAGIEEVIIGTEIEGLAIVPSGFNPSNPAELVGSTRMGILVQELKARYKDSYIVIDSTPIVSTSEPIILSQMVDGIIFVIMADKTRRDLVKAELKTIDPKKILGVVLNCAEFETSDYYYKYRKYYSDKKKD